jgi:hypothetical protein
LPPALLARLKKRGILRPPEGGSGTPTAAAAAAEEAAAGVFGTGAGDPHTSYNYQSTDTSGYAAAGHLGHTPSVSAVTPTVPAGGTAAPGAAAAAAGALPPGWQEAVDPTYNHPYYFNVTTGERSWTRPGVSPAPAAAAATVAVTTSATAGATVSASPKVISAAPVSSTAAAAALPQGWVEAVDPATGHQ